LSGLLGDTLSGTLAGFSDADPNATVDDFTVLLDWGDGSLPGTGTVTATSGGGFQVSGSHAYAQAGTYSGTVTVLDHGARVEVGFSCSVTAGQLPVTVLPPDVVVGQQTGGVVANFSDPDGDTAAADFTAAVD